MSSPGDVAIDVEVGGVELMDAAMEIDIKQKKKRSAEFLDWEAANEALLKKVSDEDKVELKKQHYQKYEYVIIFPMMGQDQTKFDEDDPDHMEQSDHAKQVVKSLLSANFSLYTFLSVQKDELIVLFTMETRYLRQFAERNDYHLPLDPVTTRSILSKGSKKHKFKAVKIADEPRFSTLRPYDHVYGKFREDIYEEDKVYKVHSENGCVLSSLDRLKLMYTALLAPKHKHGCRIQVNLLKEEERVVALFPIHSPERFLPIIESVHTIFTMPWDLPFEDIKNYFGERSTLFYVFLSHQSQWLLAPALLGSVFQVVVFSTGPNYSHPSLCFFAVLMMLWGVLMLKFYARKESRTALEWGMSDYESQEVQRPEFKGEIITSPITGQFEVYYPPESRRRSLLYSQSIITACITLVLGCVLGIYVVRFILESRVGVYASTVASIVMTVQIQVFNILYYQLAKNLNKNENHKTNTEFEDNLVVKLFVFQFINSFISFFYMAFIAMWLDDDAMKAMGLPKDDSMNANYLGQCGYYNCMAPLASNLAIIYGSRLTVDNIVAIATDLYYFKVKQSSEMSGVPQGTYIPPPEEEFMLLESDVLNDNLELFSDVAVQFGYTMLFVTALPISLLGTLLSNYVRVKLQLWKALNLKQRPIPEGAQDIGNWHSIFYVICLLSVLTNGGIICFTMDTLKTDEEVAEYEENMTSPPDAYQRAGFTPVGRLWIWFGFAFVMITFHIVVSYTLDNESEETLLQKLRMNFIISKVIDHEEDDNYDEDDDTLLISLQDDDVTEGGGEGGSCFGLFSSASAGMTCRVGKKKLPPIQVLGVPHSPDEVMQPLCSKG